jgi:hypothetical protein
LPPPGVTRRIEDNLVVEDNLAENLWYFYKIEEQTKAHMLELRPLNTIISDSKALYRRIPFSLRVTGTYEQTAAFLYAIETGPAPLQHHHVNELEAGRAGKPGHRHPRS